MNPDEQTPGEKSLPEILRSCASFATDCADDLDVREVAVLAANLLTAANEIERLEAALMRQVGLNAKLVDHEKFAQAELAEARKALTEIVRKVDDCRGMGSLGGTAQDYLWAIRQVAIDAAREKEAKP